MQELYEWLSYFNLYGWFCLVIFLEYFFPNRDYALFNEGWLSDIWHTYEPIVRPLLISSCVVSVNHLMPVDGPMKNILAHAPAWKVFLVALLVSEISFYFIHRLFHGIPILWEFHRVHHSSTRYYSLMTARFHLLDNASFIVPFIIIMSWLGCGGNGLLWFAFFQSFFDRYAHSNINGPRFSGWILMTPHFHAWHHSNEPQAINKNFSRNLVILDYLLGTAYYPKNKQAENFGDKNYSTNYFVQQIHPFYNLALKVKRFFSNIIPR